MLGTCVVAALLMFVPPCFASRTEGAVAFSKPFQVQVTVDQTGHISSMQPVPKLQDAFVKALQHTLAAWTFTPARKNGLLASTKTWLSVRLIENRLPDGNIALRYAYLGNGPYIETSQLPYPGEFHRWNIEAVFYVQATVEADGTLDHLSLAYAITSRGKPALAAAKDVMAGISHWKAHPIVVDGTPVATRVLIPAGFWLYNNHALSDVTLYYWETDKLLPASDSPKRDALPKDLPDASLAMPDDALGR